MPREPITVTIDAKVLQKFKQFCDDHDINMSKRIERYMKREVGIEK
jgi:hypothetical protein